MKALKTPTTESSATNVLFVVAIICSVFSQITPISFFTRPAMYVAWSFVILWEIVNKSGKLYISGFSRRFIVMFLFFFCFCLFSGLYLNTNYIRIMVVPLMVSFASDNMRVQKKTLDFYAIVYSVCAVIFGIWVHFTYFRSYSSWLTTQVYLFSSKNSAGQIWCSAILIILFFIDYSNKKEKILGYITVAYLIFLTGISQCRTSILGLITAFSAYAISKSKHKIRWLSLLIAVVIIAWQIPISRQFIEQSLFLNKYAGTDLNTFSSGRFFLYKKALSQFLESPIIGVGQYYVDCSYLSILTESGIVGFLLVESIWFTKISQCFHFCGEKNLEAFLYTITVFYIIESLLEAFPPFGPGVSSFMYWLLSAYIINANREPEHAKKEQIS